MDFGKEEVLIEVLCFEFSSIYKVCDNNKMKILMHNNLNKTLAKHILSISDNEGYK